MISCKRNAKYQQESVKNSILGLPRGNAMVEAKPRISIKRITPAQMDERRKRGLCYNCAEKWGLEHKCKNVKLFLLERIDIVQGLQSGVQITELEEMWIVMLLPRLLGIINPIKKRMLRLPCML